MRYAIVAVLALAVGAAAAYRATRPAPAITIQERLDRFHAAIGTPACDEVVAELGLIRDEAVENDAVRLAREGSKAERLAGLDLLDLLDIENPDTRDIVLEILRTERDPEIVAAAIYALHRGVPSPSEVAGVLAALRPLLSRAEPEIRRRALLAWADWSADPAPLTAALGDASVDVRAGAAFAVGITRADVPNRAALLAEVVADESEDWGVRDVAWHALTRLPTDEATWAVVADFKARREAYGEVAAADPGRP